MPDVDIDLADRTQLLKCVPHIQATLENNRPHNTGVYFQNIPFNPLTGTASLDYKTAEQRGYFKIDLLNVSVYRDIRDEAHLKQLMETEPIWDLLEQDEFTNLVFHVSGHGNILRTLKPRNVEQLAAALAIIRPAKRHLVNCTWQEIMKEVWVPPENNEYYFKKSHAISYATVVIVHMNLICEKISSANF